MGKVEISNLIVEKLYETVGQSLPKANVKYQSGGSGSDIVISDGTRPVINIHAVSRYVMRVEFLDTYRFDWIIDELNDDELDLFSSQIQRLSLALIQEKFQEYDLWLKVKNKFIGREIDIHFDPLGTNNITVFRSKVTFIDNVMARLVGVERRRISE